MSPSKLKFVFDYACQMVDENDCDAIWSHANHSWCMHTRVYMCMHVNEWNVYGYVMMEWNVRSAA